MNSPGTTLTPLDHDRDIAGMRYVYPVVSRRAGGVSVGINLNPNNACNWRCIYCQVPNLTRGAPPPVDLPLLEGELRRMLTEIVHGDFMNRHVPDGMRRLNDVALSGNGEPTSAREFAATIGLVGDMFAEFGLLGRVKLVLITNGSLTHRRSVQDGIKHMATLNGEVWFKFDRASARGMRQVNDTAASPDKHFNRLKMVASHCATWLQTCMFALDGMPPDEAEVLAYLAMIKRIRTEQVPVKGVLLYGLAREAMQPEAARLTALPLPWLRALAGRIETLGLPVRLTP